MSTCPQCGGAKAGTCAWCDVWPAYEAANRFTWLRLRLVVEDGLLDPYQPLDFYEASIAAFDMSGTGEEGLVWASIAAYLADLERGTRLADQRSAAAPLAAEMCARADLVEYGVALRCAWITDAGRAWLADYLAWLAAQNHADIADDIA